jgi:hypothetical protein
MHLRRAVGELLRAWYAGRISYKQLLRGLDVAEARFGRDELVDRAIEAVDDSFDLYLMSRPTWTEPLRWRDLLTFGPPDPKHPPREWKPGLARLVLWLRAGQSEMGGDAATWPFVSVDAVDRAKRTVGFLGFRPSVN